MTPYEQLRTRINELLPDRLKLEFGCEVLDANEEKATCIGWFPVGGFHYVTSKTERFIRHAELHCEPQNLGKPLTIEDVLRAVQVVAADCTEIEMIGNVLYIKTRTQGRIYRTEFNITKPVSDQEAACAAVLKLLV